MHGPYNITFRTDAWSKNVYESWGSFRDWMIIVFFALTKSPEILLHLIPFQRKNLIQWAYHKIWWYLTAAANGVLVQLLFCPQTGKILVQKKLCSLETWWSRPATLLTVKETEISFVVKVSKDPYISVQPRSKRFAHDQRFCLHAWSLLFGIV
jgi:hypothetical protein